MFSTPVARRPARSPMGWRLVAGLAAVALLASGTCAVLFALVPAPTDSGSALRPAALRPWTVCAQAVRARLAGQRDIRVTGPTLTRWETSGAGVDLTGRVTSSNARATAFGCHAIKVGSDWHVERLVLRER